MPSRTRPVDSCEVLFKPFSPVFENRIEIAVDKKFAQQPSTGSRVFHRSVDKRAAVVGLEAMLMNPQTVWAATLDVDETIWRLPLRDLALPAKRYAVQMQAIVDQRSA